MAATLYKATPLYKFWKREGASVLTVNELTVTSDPDAALN